MDFIFSYIGKVNEGLGRICDFLLVCFTIFIIFEVISRYFFNAPTDWSGQLSEQFFCLSILLSAGYIHKHDGHVNVPLIIDHLPPKLKIVMRIMACFFLVIFCGVLVWQGANLAIESTINLERSSESWSPYIFHLKIAIPLAGIMMILQELVNLKRDLHLLSGEKEKK